MMSSKVTGSRFEILNTSQSLVTGLLNKRARANTTTTTKKEAKSQWEKEIRSRSPSDSSLIVCKFCFFVLLFTTQRSTSCVISLGSLSLLRDASFLLFRFLRQRYYRLTNQRNPPIDKSREKIWRARVPSATARWPSPTFRRERGPRSFFLKRYKLKKQTKQRQGSYKRRM